MIPDGINFISLLPLLEDYLSAYIMLLHHSPCYSQSVSSKTSSSTLNRTLRVDTSLDATADFFTGVLNKS